MLPYRSLLPSYLHDTGASYHVSHAFITRVIYAPLPPELAPCVLSLFRVTYPSILSQIVIIAVIPSITNGLAKISNQISFILSSHHSSPPRPYQPRSNRIRRRIPCPDPTGCTAMRKISSSVANIPRTCCAFVSDSTSKRINIPFMEGPLSNHPRLSTVFGGPWPPLLLVL